MLNFLNLIQSNGGIMENDFKINIVDIIINNIADDTEVKRKIKEKLMLNKDLYNNYLYSSPKYKDMVISLSNMLRILSADLGREISNKYDII